MKIEIEVPAKAAASLTAAMARANIPASDIGKVAAPWIETLGEDADLTNITNGYVYQNRKAALKAVSAMGKDNPREAVIYVTYRNRRGEAATYGFPNPHGKRIRAKWEKAEKKRAAGIVEVGFSPAQLAALKTVAKKLRMTPSDTLKILAFVSVHMNFCDIGELMQTVDDVAAPVLAGKLPYHPERGLAGCIEFDAKSET